jgi:hypothetical protein
VRHAETTVMKDFDYLLLPNYRWRADEIGC